MELSPTVSLEGHENELSSRPRGGGGGVGGHKKSNSLFVFVGVICWD